MEEEFTKRSYFIRRKEALSMDQVVEDFRSGTLYITLSSSVIRNQLYFQKEALIEKMNATLSEDNLFTKDNRTTGFVRELVLR